MQRTNRMMKIMSRTNAKPLTTPTRILIFAEYSVVVDDATVVLDEKSENEQQTTKTIEYLDTHNKHAANV